MPTQSLAELHEQARHAYLHWPLWLVLRRRQVEALLAETQGATKDDTTDSSPEVALLRKAGIPLPDDLSPYTPPAAVKLDGGKFRFQVKDDSGYRVLVFERESKQGTFGCPLLRVKSDDGWYVERVAERLNSSMKTESPDLVFNAARLWASFHGGAVPEVRWEPVAREPASSWE